MSTTTQKSNLKTQNRSPLNRETGFYESNNGQFCENCGYERKTTLIAKGIWNYGVRTTMNLHLCKQCEDF